MDTDKCDNLVHNLDPAKCDDLVYSFGKHFTMAESAKHADQICENLMKEYGGKADWHSYCGRYSVLHLSREKLEALEILNGLIDGKDDELASQLKIVKEAFILRRPL